MQNNRLFMILVGVAALLLLVGVGYVLGKQSSSSDEVQVTATPSPNPPSVSEQSGGATHKAVVHRMIEEGFNQGNVDVVNEVYSPDYIGHLPSSEVNRDSLTFDDYQELIILLRTAIPDLQISGEMVIEEGNLVAVYAVLQGTFASEFYDMPPTGQVIHLAFTVIQRFDEQGKITEEWIAYDTMALMEQFGMAPGSQD